MIPTATLLRRRTRNLLARPPQWTDADDAELDRALVGTPLELPEPDDARPLGEQIRERRLGLGWTLKGTAAKVGVGFGTIANVERGKGATLAMLKRIAAVLGLQLTLEPADDALDVEAAAPGDRRGRCRSGRHKKEDVGTWGKAKTCAGCAREALARRRAVQTEPTRLQDRDLASGA